MIPTYEEFIEGKKLTAKQHVKKKAEYESRFFHKETGEEKDRVGVCEKCKKGSFSLKMENRKMKRVCKTCGDEVSV